MSTTNKLDTFSGHGKILCSLFNFKTFSLNNAFLSRQQIEKEMKSLPHFETISCSAISNFRSFYHGYFISLITLTGRTLDNAANVKVTVSQYTNKSIDIFVRKCDDYIMISNRSFNLKLNPKTAGLSLAIMHSVNKKNKATITGIYYHTYGGAVFKPDFQRNSRQFTCRPQIQERL
eukprot:UN13261